MARFSGSGKATVLCLLSVSVFVLSGCLGTAPVKQDAAVKTVQPAVANARSAQRFVVQRASISTPATVRMQAQRNNQAVVAKKADAAVGLTAAQREQQRLRDQYHARYQANLRKQQQLAKEREAKRQQAERERVQKAAERQRYIARWQREQQQKKQQQLAYRQQWEQQQRQAKQTSAPAPAPLTFARNTTATPQAVRSVAGKAQPGNPAADPRAKYVALWERKKAEQRLESKKAEQRVERVIHNAKKQIGKKYVWGGASPQTGFDCSGLVQHSIRAGANVEVPRTAAEQYRAAVKVPAAQAARGDLVFFVTRGKSVSHVGLYLGDNKFLHAPRKGLRVTTSTLSGYWKQRFVGFGRIPGACKLPV